MSAQNQPLPVDTNIAIRYWLLQGETNRQVAERLGVSRCVVGHRRKKLLRAGELPQCRCGYAKGHAGPHKGRDVGYLDHETACRNLWCEVARRALDVVEGPNFTDSRPEDWGKPWYETESATIIERDYLGLDRGVLARYAARERAS